jgi:hypothetical protein
MESASLKVRQKNRQFFPYVIFQNYFYQYSQICIQRPPLGPPKWSLYIGGRSVEVFQSKLVSKLGQPDLVCPLLTGGRGSEVAVNTVLTVV